MSARDHIGPSDTFVHRHIGPTNQDVKAMLEAVGVSSLKTLVDETIPSDIRMKGHLAVGPERGEHELIVELKEIAEQNVVVRSLVGMGYNECVTPPVIQRNIFENPGWYTQYTPYQAEIAQGRLEALMTFQTMVADLTGLPLANASLLDEATAAAEAMNMAWSIARKKRSRFVVDAACHPQTIAVVRTRAEPLGIEVDVVSLEGSPDLGNAFGVLIQYPDTRGSIRSFSGLAKSVHDAGALLIAATDLLALTVIEPPGEFGADIAIGNAQRFGVPLGGGGPHAAFIATVDKFARHLPGRIIGVSQDADGGMGYRMALQTREQHIRRDRATSNICTAQALLAIMSGMYGVYHGPEGLRTIANRVHALASALHSGVKKLGFSASDAAFFDTVFVALDMQATTAIISRAADAGFNLRAFPGGGVGVALDELSTPEEVDRLLQVFADGKDAPTVDDVIDDVPDGFAKGVARTSDYLTHPVFHRYRTEHEMLRYLHRLEARDLSLNMSMIPLGSCTMKLNATSEMLPVTWPEFSNIHPFAPQDQQQGYAELYSTLESWLANITGFEGISLQPNAGSQGEYAGLLVIRAYHASRSGGARNVCLIPTSAHGTNPASASMAGMKVVGVACDDHGNIEVADLRAKAEKHKDVLAALMVTYPSTHGVFEKKIREICDVVHEYGGQVYMDGANMNAQVGLCRPGDFGADVVHLNLHKTFCIPHGGGGPGMGPIGVKQHLVEFLPRHPLDTSKSAAIGPIAAAPHGSPSILPISWVYIALMGSAGLRRASEIAILNANYMVARLKDAYPILYTGETGRVAHEFIIDTRPFKKTAGVEVNDIAKRLMDYGFHAPTMSWPVAGTMMIEPTESESRAELDRFVEAMLAIREEIRAIEDGKMDRESNPLKHAPHTAVRVLEGDWDRPYSRQQAAFPLEWVKRHKFWPAVARIDDAYGDRNLVCTCPAWAG